MKTIEAILKNKIQNADELEMAIMRIENLRHDNSSNIQYQNQITPSLISIKLENQSFGRYLLQQKHAIDMIFVKPFNDSDEYLRHMHMLIITNVPDDFQGLDVYAEYLAETDHHRSIKKSLIFPHTYFVTFNENEKIKFESALSNLSKKKKAGAIANTYIKIFTALNTKAVILLCRPGKTLEQLENELKNLKYLVIRPEKGTFVVQFDTEEDFTTFMRDKPATIIAEPFYSFDLIANCKSLNEFNENFIKSFFHQLENLSEWFVKLIFDWKRLSDDINKELSVSLDMKLCFNNSTKMLEVQSQKPIDDKLKQRIDAVFVKFENSISQNILKIEVKKLIEYGLINLNKFLEDHIEQYYAKIHSKSSQIVIFAFTESIGGITKEIEAFIKDNSVKDPIYFEMSNRSLHDLIYSNKYIFEVFKEELFKVLAKNVELEITGSSIKFKSDRDDLKDQLASFENKFMNEKIKSEDYTVRFQLAQYFDLNKDTSNSKDYVNSQKVNESTLRLVGLDKCVSQLTDKKSISLKVNVSKADILCMRFIPQFNEIYESKNPDIKLKSHKDYLSINAPKIDAICLTQYIEETAKSLIVKELTYKNIQEIEKIESKYMEMFGKFTERNVAAALNFDEKSKLKIIMKTTREQFVQEAIAIINTFK